EAHSARGRAGVAGILLARGAPPPADTPRSNDPPMQLPLDGPTTSYATGGPAPTRAGASLHRAGAAARAEG
ncbi:MAG TPA: hypothetical protein VFS00_11525, partial [Polyangiaceae bacterium]|nr:hypothetical protein [Polyangiaceae bacterium]